MQLRDVFDDGESKSRATKCPAAVFVNPVEPLEKTRLAVFWDSDAVVDDADCRFAVRCPFNADLNLLRAAVTYCILDEVGDGGFNQPRVARTGKRLRVLHFADE